jgi:DNA modification methylase
MSQWKFKKDTAFRKQFFVPDSFAHPAKMDAQLLIKIVETYTKVGETILDPMAGSGTTMLACILGRNVILVELEEKFCKMCRDNWELVRMKPQLGYQMGTCQIIQGDARNLEGLLVDKIITSPPYAEMITRKPSDKDINNKAMQMRGNLLNYNPDNPSNISNLSYGNIDSIITSPPYEGIEARDRSKESWWDEDREKKHSGGSTKIAKGDQADAVITSPPYEAAVTGKDGIDWSKGTRGKAEGNKPRDRSKEPAFNHLSIGGAGFAYSQAKDNIGNLKSDSYLSAMLEVYRQCYSVLKSGGLMILVTKNFIRNKKIVRLDTDTIKLCEQAGFKFIERHYRELPAQSFWRIIYKRKYPDVPEIKFEDILVFNKANSNLRGRGGEEKQRQREQRKNIILF